MTCVIPLLFILLPCHEPTGRINSGDGSSFSPSREASPATSTGAGGREAPNIITGTPGDDFLVGTPGPDRINGGDGNDVICGDPGCGPTLDRIRERGW